MSDLLSFLAQNTSSDDKHAVWVNPDHLFDWKIGGADSPQWKISGADSPPAEGWKKLGTLAQLAFLRFAQDIGVDDADLCKEIISIAGDDLVAQARRNLLLRASREDADAFLTDFMFEEDE